MRGSATLSFALLALAGCVSSPPSALVVTPERYLPEPRLPALPAVEPDPLAQARARVRILELSHADWPPVGEWDDGTPPVDRGDGVLYVRPTTVPCRWDRRADCAVRPWRYHGRPARSSYGRRGGWRRR